MEMNKPDGGYTRQMVWSDILGGIAGAALAFVVVALFFIVFS